MSSNEHVISAFAREIDLWDAAACHNEQQLWHLSKRQESADQSLIDEIVGLRLDPELDESNCWGLQVSGFESNHEMLAELLKIRLEAQFDQQVQFDDGEDTLYSAEHNGQRVMLLESHWNVPKTDETGVVRCERRLMLFALRLGVAVEPLNQAEIARAQSMGISDSAVSQMNRAQLWVYENYGYIAPNHADNRDPRFYRDGWADLLF